MLNLSDLSNLEELIKEYNLCVSNGHYCYDGDLEQLFSDSDITQNETILKAKEFDYDDDTFEPIGSKYGDYLETITLEQNGKEYLCQAFVEHNGCGADYALALMNIEEKSKNKIYAVKFFDDDGSFNMNTSDPIFYYKSFDRARAKLQEGFAECFKYLLNSNEKFTFDNNEDSYDIEVDGLVVHSGSVFEIKVED